MSNIENKILDIYNSSDDKNKVLRIFLRKENRDCIIFLDKKYPMLSNKKYSTGMKIYWFVKGYSDFPKCIECGEPNKTHRCYINGYYTNFCSRKCSHGKCTTYKIRETTLNKYGVYNVALLDSTKEKRTKTNMEKYNCENVFQNKEIKEKSLKTNKIKYGDEKYTNRDKQKTTNILKYGCDNPFGNKDIQEKIRETNLMKYGVQHPMKNESIRDKVALKSRVYLVHNSYENYLKTNPYSKPNFSEDFYLKHRDKRYEFEFVCDKCGMIYKSRVHNGTIRRCPKCYSQVTTSGKEQELYDFISSIYKLEIERKNRTILQGQELDIFIPEKRIAIEFDGMYWHSELNGIDKRYHLNKTEKCEENNVRLIHVFEDEWDKKQNIVKSRIKNMFGIYENTVYARKCEIRKIETVESMDFQNANHLQGYARSSYCIGLYFKNELISLMSFCKPRISLGNKKENGTYELLRFCNKNGYHITGAASKLLKFFEREVRPTKLITYADRRWSNGNLYEKLGFTFKHNSEPNYWYLNNGCEQRYHRLSFRKSELKKKLKKFDESKTEVENMRMNKFTRIFDCGNMVFIKEY